MAQPDFELIADSLRTLSDQVSLVPNIPGVGALQQNVANLDQPVGNLQQSVANLDQRVGDLDRQVTNNHRVLLETINTNQGLMLDQMQRNHLGLSRQLTQLTRLQDEHNLLLLRLYNSSLTENEPLRYPPALDVRYPLPLSRLDLNRMPADQCIQAANLLQLLPFPPGTPVTSRRRQIAEHLGAPIPF